MKTTFRLIGAVAAVAALFSSCKKEAFNEEVKQGTVEMTIIAGADDATRTVLGSDGAVTWAESGETLAVLENSVKGSEKAVAKKESKAGETTDGGRTMKFGVSLSEKTADTYDYYAIYPNGALVENPSDFAQVKIQLASTQYPTASSFGPAADILVSNPILGETAQPTSLELQFARVVAIGKMAITNLNPEENVQKVTFTATGKTVTGSSKINMTDASGVEYGYSGQGVDNVVLDYRNKTIAANGMTAYFTCWPFELAAEETFSVVVETENYTFTKDVTLTAGKSLAFKAGRASEFNVNFADVKGVAKEPVNLKYELVQASDDIVDGGKYLIVYDGNCALGQYNADKKYYEKVDVTADNNIITITNQSVVVISLEGTGTEGQFYIKDSDDQYMYYAGSANEVQRGKLTTEYAYKWTVTKNKITNVGTSTRFFQYNTSSYRFTCYLSKSNQKDVTLYVDRSTVKAKPSISVQKTLDVPSAETTDSFPVKLTNVKTASVNVYQDAACTTLEEEWMTADFNAESTAIEYYAKKNTGKVRTAYIKIHAQGPEATEATAIVTVTQAASGSTSYCINATDGCFSANESAYQAKEKSFTANDGSVWLFNGYSVSAGTSFAIGKGGANYITTPSSSKNIKSITVNVKGNTSYYLTVKTSNGNTELLSTQYTNASEFYEYTFNLSSLSDKYTQVRLVSRRASGTSNAAGTFESITVTYE